MLSVAALSFLPAQSLPAASCIAGQQAMLVVKADLQTPEGATSSVNDAQYLFAVSTRLRTQGLRLIDQEVANQALNDQQKQRILAGDAVGALELARKMAATWLVQVFVSGREVPLKGVATSLRSVSGQLGVRVLQADNGRILSDRQLSFKQAGLDPTTAMSTALEQKSAELLAGVLDQACTSGPAPAAPASSPAPPVATGAARLDPKPPAAGEGAGKRPGLDDL
jgi:hypothetical protein